MNLGLYTDVIELPDGRHAAVVPYLFTHGLCVGIDPSGNSHQTRYCYAHEADAVAALHSWDGTGDPSGPWIKQKPQDRTNPLLEQRRKEADEALQDLAREVNQTCGVVDVDKKTP